MQIGIGPAGRPPHPEVAECPRLIKGYGDTHARGSRSYDALMAALPKLRRMTDAAERFRKLREAALEDLSD